MRTTRRYSGSRRLTLFVTTIILAAIASLGWIAYVHNKASYPFPASFQSVGYPILYPARLPAGFTIKGKTIERTSNVVSYTVAYDNGKQLIFTQQPRPADFDYERFQGSAKKLTTPFGEAYAGAAGDQTVVSLVMDKSWLIIGIPQELRTTDLQRVLNGLTEAK